MGQFERIIGATLAPVPIREQADPVGDGAPAAGRTILTSCTYEKGTGDAAASRKASETTTVAPSAEAALTRCGKLAMVPHGGALDFHHELRMVLPDAVVPAALLVSWGPHNFSFQACVVRGDDTLELAGSRSVVGPPSSGVDVGSLLTLLEASQKTFVPDPSPPPVVSLVFG